MNAKILSKIFKKAHELAKSIRKAGDSYRDTFALCLKYVRRQAEALADALNMNADFSDSNLNAKAWMSPDGRIVRVYVREYVSRFRNRDHGFVQMSGDGMWDHDGIERASVWEIVGRAMRDAGMPCNHPKPVLQPNARPNDGWMFRN